MTGDAIACLESQSAEPGLTGEIALLELARIRRDVKGDLAGAERLLADHERRFPQSALATEARSGRIELLLRLGRPAEALAEAQRLGGSEAIYWRAVSLTALGRRDEARRRLRGISAASRHPPPPRGDARARRAATMRHAGAIGLGLVLCGTLAGVGCGTRFVGRVSRDGAAPDVEAGVVEAGDAKRA